MSKILMDKKVIKSMEEINRVMIGKERTVHQIMTAIGFFEGFRSLISENSVYTGYYADRYCRIFYLSYGK